MSTPPAGWYLQTHTAIREIDSRDWDLCAGSEPATDATESSGEGVESEVKDSESKSQLSYPNPFISFDFLASLEDAGCVGGRTGWHPAHQVLREAEGTVIAVAPTYVKSHSQGEYVFDHGWAEAYERAGGTYYPKVQVTVPFTPATGPRLLIRRGTDHVAAVAALAGGLETLRQKIGGSSIHATFLPEAEAQALAAQGYLLRNDRQFHWDNAGYRQFDDFLAALSSRKRKMIRRERKDALDAGITIRWLTGKDIKEADWDAFFAFYMDTGSRKWGRPYLNRQFFSLIGERMSDCILLVMAERAGKPIAGAINFIGADALYGRNWGAIEEHPFLHFEVCYYQAMDFAIAHKLARVEAGAQGEHKLLRGYRPVTTWSAHAIDHAGLRAAVARFLLAEREAVAGEKIELDKLTPFRRSSDA